MVTVDDSVWRQHKFAEAVLWSFRDHAARARKRNELIDRDDDALGFCLGVPF
jgi:hypothetical protein